MSDMSDTDELYNQRVHTYSSAQHLHHITADEVPAAFNKMGWKDGVAKVIAERSADDAKYILDVTDEVYDAVVDYVKPRWPELF